jgi:hypothetical protein
MSTTIIHPRRLEIAIKACDDTKTADLMSKGDELGWQSIANMFACDLQQAHQALSGGAVYDYESQSWIHAE